MNLKLSPRRIAQEVLARFQVIAPPVPVLDIAQALGATVKYEPFPGELSGMIYQSEEMIIIGINSSHSPTRQRFTLAHELGHWLLSSSASQSMHVDKGFTVQLRDERSALAIDPQEILANRFAAEMLMPINMVHAALQDKIIDITDDDQLKAIARTFEVSVQALIYRLTNLGLLQPDAFL